MKYIEIQKKYYNEAMMLWQVTFQIHGQTNYKGQPDINMVGVKSKYMVDATKYNEDGTVKSDDTLMDFLNSTYL